MRIYSRNVPDLLHWAQAVWRWSNRVLIMWRMWWFDGIWDAQSEPSSRGFSSARKRTLPLILLIWTSETQVMAKRRAGSRTASLTPDHKKSGIDPIYLAAGRVPHITGKLSTKATTLLQTASRSEVCSQNYGAPKSRESHLAISRLSLESPGKNSHLDVASVESCRVYYKGEGGGFP
jgi:hypothetical protein